MPVAKRRWTSKFLYKAVTGRINFLPSRSKKPKEEFHEAQEDFNADRSARLDASAGAVSAADDTAASTQAQPDAAAQAQAQARRAVRDKETGKLRAPTQEELKVMLEDERAARRARGQPEPSAEPTPIVVRQYPSGMRSAVLGRDFLINIQAQRRTDGKVEMSHTDPAHDHPTAKSQRPTE